MARQTASLDQPRYAQWVNVSHSIEAIEPGLSVFIQGMGKVDAQLIHNDGAFRLLSSAERASFDKSIELTDRFTLSHLWVLGAYEVVRTLDQRIRTNPTTLTKRLAQRVRTTKKHFERLRIPLAKLEPARAHKHSDYRVALPAMHRELGISWKVAKKKFIARRALADRLLDMLTQLERYRERKTRHLTARSSGRAKARRSA